MRLKDGVRPGRVSADIVLALVVADGVFRSWGEELVVTSLRDGRHSPASLHYVGDAADLRRPARAATEVAEMLGRRLGADYDVVVEVDHLHVEYQPKGPG